MKKNGILWMFATLMLAIGMGSCSSDDLNVSLNREWIMVSYVNETGDVLKEAKGYYYTLTFNPDGTYSGLAYGNKLGGKYECKGNTIKIFDSNITQKYVEGSDPDRFFLDRLHDVYLYTMSDSELKLYFAKDQFFKFRARTQ